MTPTQSWHEVIPGFWATEYPQLPLPTNPALRKSFQVHGNYCPDSITTQGELRSTTTSPTWDLNGIYPRLTSTPSVISLGACLSTYFPLQKDPYTITCSEYTIYPNTKHVVPVYTNLVPVKPVSSWIYLPYEHRLAIISLTHKKAIIPKAYRIHNNSLQPQISHIELLRPLTPEEWGTLGLQSIETGLQPYRIDSYKEGFPVINPFDQNVIGLSQSELAGSFFATRLVSATVTDCETFKKQASLFLKITIPKTVTSNNLKLVYTVPTDKSLYTTPYVIESFGYFPYFRVKSDKNCIIPPQLYPQLLSKGCTAPLFADAKSKTPVYRQIPTTATDPIFFITDAAGTKTKYTPTPSDTELQLKRDFDYLINLGFPSTLDPNHIPSILQELTKYTDLLNSTQSSIILKDLTMLQSPSLYPKITICGYEIPYISLTNIKQALVDCYATKSNAMTGLISYLIDNPDVFEDCKALHTLKHT